jgi:hypothetical protein
MTHFFSFVASLGVPWDISNNKQSLVWLEGITHHNQNWDDFCSTMSSCDIFIQEPIGLLNQWANEALCWYFV